MSELIGILEFNPLVADRLLIGVEPPGTVDDSSKTEVVCMVDGAREVDWMVDWVIIVEVA